MTNKEASRLLAWSKEKGTPKPINGYIDIHGTVVALFDTSEWDKEYALKYNHFTIYPNNNGFRITEYGITCISNNHKRMTIPFRYIQSVRLYNYNY